MNQQTSLFTSMDTQSKEAYKNEKTAPAQAEKPAAKIRPRGNRMDQIYETLVNGLKRYFEKYHFRQAVLGLSGGVDSSLVLHIAVSALGPEKVTALIMPELGVTKQENIDHAKILCKFFGIGCFYQPINNFMTDFAITPWKPNKYAHMNTKARIRAALLYNYANSENALVLGTSNKSELMLGYATKYGDLCCDIEVIGDLYKTEVIKLADHAGLPPEIVNKTPSAELHPDQTDEGELGASYRDLDKVLMKLDLGMEGCVEHGLPMQLVQFVFRRVEQNKHKREMPPVIKIGNL